ncbi:thioredoxin-dependent thiol peroxidase [Roseibium sp.]|uniref:thioredoxin-dependent thiol peroxidase n=1 Tax=Roseibium sp. TaxID=1936156 RepID=UPI003D1149AA
MGDLAIGDAAPDFDLESDGSGRISLKALLGKPLVVYFYPKDNTPGCTTEAIDFSARMEEFEKLGVTIVGLSPDSARKHDNFIAKHNLTVRLAADTETVAAQAYGVWVEKSMYGKKYMGIDRSTFLVDSEGKIAQIWRKVKVQGHADAVLEAAKAL